GARAVYAHLKQPTKKVRGVPAPPGFANPRDRLFGRLRRRFLVPLGHDRDVFASAAAAAELHRAVHGGEDRVVAAHADIGAGVKLGAALAHDDVAGQDDLAAEFLDAEPFAGAVAAVARG